MTDSPGGSGFGGKLASRVAEVAVEAMSANRVRLAPHSQEMVALALERFFNLVSTEMDATVGPMLQRIGEHPDAPDWARDSLTFLGSGRGQWRAILGAVSMGAGMAPGLGELISNELGPVIQDLIARNPHTPLTPDAYADTVARGIPIEGDPWHEAARSGVGADRFNALIELHRTPLALTEILTLVSRGRVDAAGAVKLLQRAGYPPELHADLVQLAQSDVPGAMLADMVVRGVITVDEGATLAHRTGVSNVDFGRMVEVTGEPPGVQDLLFLYRRGRIDRARLERGIRQSRYRNEWTDAIEALSHSPMSTSDALRAANQGNLTVDEARHIADLNGLEPADFQPLMDTEGEPPGVEKMVELWHRGKLTRDELVKGIKESRLKNKYIDAMIEGGETLPPEATIRRMHSSGAISAERAIDLYLQRGYAPDVAHALLTVGTVEKTAKQRDITVSQILDLFEQRAITEMDARAVLSAHGYDEHEQGWLLLLPELRRAQKFRNAVIARVGTAFVKNRITEEDASATLDAAGVPPDERDDLLAIWDLEKATNIAVLTVAQIQQAFRRGFIDEANATGRLRDHGYDGESAAILLALAAPAPRTRGGEV